MGRTGMYIGFCDYYDSELEAFQEAGIDPFDINTIQTILIAEAQRRLRERKQQEDAPKLDKEQQG